MTEIKTKSFKKGFGGKSIDRAEVAVWGSIAIRVRSYGRFRPNIACTTARCWW